MTAAEIDRLHKYIRQAMQPQIVFTPEEARDLRELAERVIEEQFLIR